MKRSTLFHAVLDIVCEECEIRKETVLSEVKIQPAVDARMLTTQYLIRKGMSADDIALVVLRARAKDVTYCPSLEEIKSKARGINRMFNDYSRRCMSSELFISQSREICKKCENILMVEE